MKDISHPICSWHRNSENLAPDQKAAQYEGCAPHAGSRTEADAGIRLVGAGWNSSIRWTRLRKVPITATNSPPARVASLVGIMFACVHNETISKRRTNNLCSLLVSQKKLYTNCKKTTTWLEILFGVSLSKILSQNFVETTQLTLWMTVVGENRTTGLENQRLGRLDGDPMNFSPIKFSQIELNFQHNSLTFNSIPPWCIVVLKPRGTGKYFKLQMKICELTNTKEPLSAFFKSFRLSFQVRCLKSDGRV